MRMPVGPRAATIGEGMAVPYPLPDDLVELIAERFRALSEPTRIKLLDRLREGEATVLELTALIATDAIERLQVPWCPAAGRHRRPSQAGQLRLLPNRQRSRPRALRDGLPQPARTARGAPSARRRFGVPDARSAPGPSGARPSRRVVECLAELDRLITSPSEEVTGRFPTPTRPPLVARGGHRARGSRSRGGGSTRSRLEPALSPGRRERDLVRGELS